MTTSIKIDFDDNGACTHVRANGVLLPGATCDLSALDSLFAIIADVTADEVLASVEDALQANLVTLQEAERHKKRAARLDALLVQKRAEVADLDARIAEAATVKAIVDKQAVMAALERDVAEIVAIADKQATLAALDVQIAEKEAALEEPVEVVK